MLFAFLNTLFVVAIGTFSGYFFKVLADKKKLLSVENLKKLSIFLQKFSMLGLMTIAYIGSLWIFNIEEVTKIITIPFLGALSILIGGLFAVLVAKLSNYNRLDTGSMFCCGYFSNQISIGGMICFFYLGEEGYALMPIFTFFMNLLYYGLGFPIANMYSDNTVKQKKAFGKIIGVTRDPFFYIGMGAVILGFILNVTPLKRPLIYKTINATIIPLSTFILLFSIGITFKFNLVSKYLKECLYISIIKFIIVPVVILIFALLLGYQHISQGLPLKVSFILSAMPVAFNSVIAANVYNLNIDLVNSCWIFTTFGVLLILPFILFVINMF